MNRISFSKQILLGFTALFIISCDKDFNEIGADIIGDDHYALERVNLEVTANTIATGPVQSNNLPINPLGIYDNPTFGTTKAHFVTQLELATPAPNVGTNIEMQSVILSVPYFSKVISNNADASKTYKIDSLYGGAASRINLKIYRSGYFLGNLSYEDGSQVTQKYYTDQNADFDAVKVGGILNNAAANSENSEFFFNPQEIVENVTSADGTVTAVKSAPQLRLQLDAAYFKSQVLETAAANLQSNNAFKNYFRGLYFNVSKSGTDPGALALLNFAAGSVTIKYKADITTTNSTGTSTTRMDRVIVLKMSGNTVSLLENTALPTSTLYQNALSAPTSNDGQSRVYVKGGEGALTAIDLFGTTDVTGPDGVPNGIPDSIDEMRENNWLINEASLTFYVDRASMGSDSQNGSLRAPEPNRLYLYDVTNKRPLLDYVYDNTTSGNAKFNKRIYGGILETDSDGRGTKYKIRLTNYLRSVVRQDSTSVKLALAVTENIGVVSMAKLKNNNTFLNNFIPTTSVYNPLGTVIYGNNIINSNPNDANSDYNKRMRLEIFYTKPN